MGTGRGDRLLQLDGLRGLAALSVFLTHYALLDPQWAYPHGWTVNDEREIPLTGAQ